MIFLNTQAQVTNSTVDIYRIFLGILHHYPVMLFQPTLNRPNFCISMLQFNIYIKFYFYRDLKNMDRVNKKPCFMAMLYIHTYLFPNAKDEERQ